MSPLLAFYLGSHPDHRGRLLADIVEQDDDWLEYTHDYIQWLFPLEEHSRAVPSAPILRPDDVRAFREDALLRDHMRAALHRMLAFYGLALVDGKVQKAPNWAQRSGNWFTEATHNDLRVTRILKSLMTAGLEHEARAFHTCLKTLCADEPTCGVPLASREFWSRAVESTGARNS